MSSTETDLLYLRDAYQQTFSATVVDTRVDENGVAAIALDQTAFYATGGGQPHDAGTLDSLPVTNVRKEGGLVWHTVDISDSAESGETPLPAVGSTVEGTLDWDRRHELMRTHTALHILCGVIWNEWGVAVTGGNMEPLKARMDFEFDPLPEGLPNALPIWSTTKSPPTGRSKSASLPRPEALADEDLIRTKVNLIPEFVTEIRVVDIVGLDKQADGGTHVASTKEVGTFRRDQDRVKGQRQQAGSYRAQLGAANSKLDVLWQILERGVAVGARFAGKTKNSFADDVPLNLIGAAVDGGGLGVQNKLGDGWVGS